MSKIVQFNLYKIMDLCMASIQLKVIKHHSIVIHYKAQVNHMQ